MDTPLPELLTGRLGLARDEAAGKVIVITGAGRGIGRQAALAFAHLGGAVVIAEISNEGAQVEADICARGGNARFIRTDVSDPASVAALHEETLATSGPPDVLINNAILCPVAAVSEMEVALWERVIAVNLGGTFLTCRAFLPEMLARGSGVIVNMVSTDAMPGLSAYIASKQGIAGFSQSLALETGERGVQVIPFAPGMVDTPGIRGVSDGLAPRLGMTREQFLGLSLHAAYEGLMPAEHAGAATVYLALRLAHECHGQATDGYEVLERAGLLKAPLDGQAPLSGTSSPVEATGPLAPAPQPGDLPSLAAELAELIAVTGGEFNRLPVFVRPIARQGFKSKAGESLENWQRAAQALAEGATPPAGLVARLDRLINYYRGVPAETARFTRDAEMLRQVAEISEKRIALIERIQALVRNC